MVPSLSSYCTASERVNLAVLQSRRSVLSETLENEPRETTMRIEWASEKQAVRAKY